MAVTPVDIKSRPFSVEYYTNIMLPDGIFDTALKKQWITCFCTNVSNSTLQNVNIYLEGVGDLGIIPIPTSYSFKEIKAGASVRVAWLSDFENGSPGKKLVSYIFQANGMTPNRVLKTIFVSKTTRNMTTGEYSCITDVGTLKVSKIEVIGPKDKWEPCSEHYKECRPAKGPWVPNKLSMTFQPDPPYTGIHGDLPYGDPWWKIFAWIVALIAAIVAIIAAAEGEGTAGTAVGGNFDESNGNVDCCTPDPSGIPGDDSTTVAGVASAIATAAAAVGMSDEADPWWRGQEATPPASGELTKAENVDVEFGFPVGAPKAGLPYTVNVKWKYQRITTGKTYTYSIGETQKNTHLNGGVIVNVPAIHHAFDSPLIIKSQFKRPTEGYFAGDDLYVFSLLCSPDNMYFIIDLSDDGNEPDDKPNDGIYTGTVDFKSIYKLLLRKKLQLEGLWHIYLFAQDTNKAKPDLKPQEAAKQIGGFMIASSLQLTFDPTLPCPLQSQATVTVVK